MYPYPAGHFGHPLLAIAIGLAEVDAYPFFVEAPPFLSVHSSHTAPVLGDTGSYSLNGYDLSRPIVSSIALAGGKYVSLPRTTNEIRAANAMSFAVALKVPSLTATGENMRILTAADGAHIDFYVSQDGRVGLTVAAGGGDFVDTQSPTGTVKEGVWSMVGFTHDGENVTLYYGDFAVATASVGATYCPRLLTQDTAFNLGEYRDTVLGEFYFEGELGCPRLWARSLPLGQWRSVSQDPYVGLPGT